jgi:Rap1a immunity proteins
MRAVSSAMMLLVLVSDALAAAETRFESANRVLPACKRFIEGPKPIPGDAGLVDVSEQSLCVGMVDGLFYVSPILPPEQRACPPPGTTKEQLVRVVVAYIERQPQRMQLSFKLLALEAFHQAWPCR